MVMHDINGMLDNNWATGVDANPAISCYSDRHIRPHVPDDVDTEMVAAGVGSHGVGIIRAPVGGARQYPLRLIEPRPRCERRPAWMS